MTAIIIKALRPAEWAAFAASGRFEGSAADLADGFIHFSTADQLPGTLARHFTDVTEVVLLHVDSAALGTALKWEPSRGGALFPHLYRALVMGEVARVEKVPLR